MSSSKKSSINICQVVLYASRYDDPPPLLLLNAKCSSSPVARGRHVTIVGASEQYIDFSPLFTCQATLSLTKTQTEECNVTKIHFEEWPLKHQRKDSEKHDEKGIVQTRNVYVSSMVFPSSVNFANCMETKICLLPSLFI